MTEPKDAETTELEHAETSEPASENHREVAEEPPPSAGKRFVPQQDTVVHVHGCCDHEHHHDPPKIVPCLLVEKEPAREHCCFDVYMTKVWVTAKGGDKDNKSEIMITGYANEQSGVFPGMGLYASLNSNWGWCNINTKVGTFRVEKGSLLPIYVRLDYIEVDIAAAGAWELGSDNGAEETEPDGPIRTMTLVCDSQGPIRTRLAAWAHKAKGGGNSSRIAVEFTAFPRSCC